MRKAGVPTHTKFERRLEAIRLATIKQLEDLAAQYRSSVLVPLCKKYKLSFHTVNSDCWFTNQDGISVFYDFEADDKGIPWVKDAFKTLDLPCPLRSVFGSYLKDIPLGAP